MSCTESVLNLFFCIIVCGLIPICFFEFQYRDPTELFLPKISITLIIIGFVIWYFSENDEDENDEDVIQYGDNVYYNIKNTKYNNNYSNMMANKSYIYKTDMNSYQQITKENTKKELDKLMKTKEFREMSREKGNDSRNWNWQSRERMQRESQKSDSFCNFF